MSFNLKPKQTFTGSGETSDWKAIADAVMGTATNASRSARVSVIVDLGEQEQDEALSQKQETEFETEADADAMIAKATPMINKQNPITLKKEFKDGKWVVNANIYRPKPCREVAVMVDIPNKVVDYGSFKAPYRLLLNGSFMGNLKGFQMKAVNPNDSTKNWTFASNNKLYKLAQAVGEQRIVSGLKSDTDHNMNIGLVLGKPMLITVKRKGDFLSAGDFTAVPEEMVVGDLPTPPIGVSFDDATPELLEAAKLRPAIIAKIKAALDYKGSNMEKAMIAFENGGGVKTQAQTQAQDQQETPQEADSGVLSDW